MPPDVQGYDTAEEYPFASTNEGGQGYDLHFRPVTY